jgi:hypothetical protein
MNTGKEPIYGNHGLPQRVLAAVQIVATASLVWTVVVVSNHLSDRTNSDWAVRLHACWLWWVVTPPIWFSFEYFSLYKRKGQEGTFEAFKYGQELASRAWLGIAAVLTVIASK